MISYDSYNIFLYTYMIFWHDIWTLVDIYDILNILWGYLHVIMTWYMNFVGNYMNCYDSFHICLDTYMIFWHDIWTLVDIYDIFRIFCDT